MKRIGLFWIKSLLWLCPIGLSAQVDIYNVDAANNGTTVNYDIVGSAVGICDNGGPDARYTPGDYYLTVTSNCVAPNRFCFIIGVSFIIISNCRSICFYTSIKFCCLSGYFISNSSEYRFIIST